MIHVKKNKKKEKGTLQMWLKGPEIPEVILDYLGES